MRRPIVRASAMLTAGALLFLAAACNRTSGAGAAKEDLAMVPKDTDVVIMANVAQARQSQLWKKLMELRDKDQNSKQKYDEFVKKCNFDAMNAVDSVFIALPQNVQESKEFAIVARGTFDPDSLVNCMKSQAKERNEEVAESEYNGQKVYGFGREKSYFAPLSKKLVVLGGKTWINRVLDLYKNKGDGSAKDHKELSEMIKRTRTGDALWWAGLVPPSAAQKLTRNPMLGAAGSLKSTSGSIDLGKGLALHALLDLGSDADATALSNTATEQLGKAKQMPQLQMMGLASFLETIKISSKGNSFVFDLALTNQQVDDLSARLSGLAKSFMR